MRERGSKRGIISQFILIFLTVAFISGAHGFFIPSALSLLLLILLCSTAYPLTRLMLGSRPGCYLLTLPVGYVVHSILLSVFTLILGISEVFLWIYFLIAILTSAVLLRTLKLPEPRVFLEHWSNKDRWILFLWLATTAGAVAVPFLRVGAETGDGYAYRAYFNTDFFRNLATIGSLIHSGVPPVNPYFSGETLHYYWFFHIIPAWWSVLFKSFPKQFLLVQFSLFSDLLFVTTLFVVLKHFCRNRLVLLLAIPLFLFGGSYEGIYALQELGRRKLPWEAFTSLNIDGILRWTWHAPQIDTLFRPLLYAPQHLMVVTIFLISLLVWTLPKGFASRFIHLTLLLSSVGFSVILGAVLIVGAVVIEAREFLSQPQKKWIRATAAVLLGILFYFAYFKLFRMFSADPGDLRFGIDPTILAHWPLYFVLNWGALLPLGLAGIAFQPSTVPRKLLFSYLVLCLVMLTSIRLNVNAGSDISLKIGYLSSVVLLILAAGFIEHFLNHRPSQRIWLFSTLAVLMLPAFLTWMMDVYNCQDIQNKRFTTYVTREEAQILSWIDSNLENDANLQNYNLEGKGFVANLVSEIPAFAGRPVFVGDPILSRIFQIPQNKVNERRDLVYALFHSKSPFRISLLATKSGIQYLLLDERWASILPRANLISPYFTLIHERGSYSLYKVNPFTITAEDLDGRNLFKDENGYRIQANFVRNFYPPEQIAGDEIARWMSDQAVIELKSSIRIKASLFFFAHSLGRARKMQIRNNDEAILEVEIPTKAIQVSLPLEILEGITQIEFVSLDGAERANVYVGGEDKRLLSFRIWNLELVPKKEYLQAKIH